MTIIGAPLTRVDGSAKVTGRAQYSGDFAIPNAVVAVMVQSTIPSGHISNIEIAKAQNAPGVLAILTPANAPKLPGVEKRVSVLQNDEVHYNGQPVAVVIAENSHSAYHAASLVKVSYEQFTPKLDFIASFPTSRTASHNNEPGDVSWGSVDAGLSQAEIKIDQIYTTPIEHHNPMEPHATIAQWNGDHLELHDATQNIFGVKQYLAKAFGIPQDNVHVTTLFVGGGFGCKGQIWSHVILAAMAAKQVNRPVKLILQRPQMFGPVGARPMTHQHLVVGAMRNGKLTAIKHDVHAHTSEIEDYLESSAFPTRVMYACENVSTTHRIVPMNLGTPTYMRAPGVATGTYALEVAMDELAHELKMDPLELRIFNYTDVDPHTKKPFTEKSLHECYSRAAEKFGWAKRIHEPRSMRNGSQLTGWGMATETYPCGRMAASAYVRLLPTGRAEVASGTVDIGNGMYTIMTQVAAQELGLPANLVDAKLGDTTLPQAPLAAGSMSTTSVMPAVKDAATNARLKLINLAIADAASPVYGATADQVDIIDGNISLKSAPGRSENFAALIARNGGQPIQGDARATLPANWDQYARHSFGAVFAEVTVDADLGTIKVPRIVAVFDVGKIMNAKTAHSQFIGGIVWGISLALHEETYIDQRNGRIANANFAEYRVPVNADIGDIDVSAIDAPDPIVDSVGARGIGEIGITGTGAAVANAIFHATGKRVRELPITPDKLLI
jgi:xanthine dehydrogenase YagR molybdenum-binding subunit